MPYRVISNFKSAAAGRVYLICVCHRLCSQRPLQAFPFQYDQFVIRPLNPGAALVLRYHFQTGT